MPVHLFHCFTPAEHLFSARGLVFAGRRRISSEVGGCCGYDSNFYRDSANDATSSINPVTVLRLGLDSGRQRTELAMVKLSLESRFRYITADDADETASPLDDDFALDTIKSGLTVSLLPKSSFTLI